MSVNKVPQGIIEISKAGHLGSAVGMGVAVIVIFITGKLLLVLPIIVGFGIYHAYRFMQLE